MIIEYHRPETLEQAKKLLNRETPLTTPLGGGTKISRPSDTPVAVVDLQSLGLDQISRDIEKNKWHIGAMARLQDLVDCRDLPSGLREAARRETSINLRRTGTLGGVLITADGRSPLLGCLLALDVKVFWEPGKKSIYLGEWLSKGRDKKPGKLITEIEFITPTENDFDDIARSPEDRPTVYVVTAKWETGDTRIVMGGSGKYPVLGSAGSKNLISEVFHKFTGTSMQEKEEFSEYQKAAISILIERMTERQNIICGKG